MSVTEVTQEYGIQNSADQDNEDFDIEGIGDLTVPKINNNKRHMALVGEHHKHIDEGNVPPPPKRFQTSYTLITTDFSG